MVKFEIKIIFCEDKKIWNWLFTVIEWQFTVTELTFWMCWNENILEWEWVFDKMTRNY